jgi:xanthine dehydrogenase YagS FAD-binding subunit
VPATPIKAESNFMKFALRKSIDFAIVNCAVLTGNGTTRICLNGIAQKPYRAIKAEEIIAGKSINETIAEKAGEAAVSDAKPFPDTKYKVQIAKTLVKRALLAAVKAS